MTTTLVKNEAQLLSALNKAHGGDTIELVGGTYGTVCLSNYHFSSAVTVTSENSSSPAILNGLKMGNDSGLTFKNLELTSVGSSDPYFAFRVASSQNITFTNVTAQGNLSEPPGVQMSGFYISQSTNITIKNSVLTDFNSAITANYDSNVSFSSNSFTLMNKGGVEAGADSYLSVTNNNFSNFETSNGIHGDAIQIYTAGLSKGSNNLVISGNLIDRGSGDAAQGILVQDENGNTPNMNVTIDSNTIIGMQWNGIYLNNATGSVQVDNNKVESYAGYDVMTGGTTNFTSWIRLNAVTSASITEVGNSAQHYLVGQSVVATPSGNSMIATVSDAGASALNSWATTHSSELGLLSNNLLSALGIHNVVSLVGIL